MQIFYIEFAKDLDRCFTEERKYMDGKWAQKDTQLQQSLGKWKLRQWATATQLSEWLKQKQLTTQLTILSVVKDVEKPELTHHSC